MKRKSFLLCILVVLFVGIINSCDNGNKNAKEEPINIVKFSNDINSDILTRHALPKFERMIEKDRTEFVESLQVIQKIDGLKLDRMGFLYPEKNLIDLEKELEAKWEFYDLNNMIIFEGNSSIDLQKTINENSGKVIVIASDYVNVTESIELKSDICIFGNGTEFKPANIRNVFTGNGIKNVVIDEVVISGEAEYGIFVANSENIRIANCTISGMKEKPICMVESKYINISNNILKNNGAGGIYVSGNSNKGLIQGNTISNNLGTSNWMAGIVLTNVESNDCLNIWETFDEAHHFPYKENLYTQLKCPHDIILKNNTVSYNNSSGIYSDGAYNCYLLKNNIEENDKEGLCLDYGTMGFYLKENIIEGNGKRQYQTDEDLKMDFVLEAGRMEDGSAKSKLPGVSLDNTAYNILENNIVINNYGGGIKMVRTAVRNLVSENIIKDNNKGENDVYHFFGIEIGSAVGDVEAMDMDFTPSYENIVCRNTITGRHYSGVFIGEECYVNDIFDNVIMEPEMFAVEAVSVKFNSILNNFSNAGIRNEYRK